MKNRLRRGWVTSLLLVSLVLLVQSPFQLPLGDAQGVTVTTTTYTTTTLFFITFTTRTVTTPTTTTRTTVVPATTLTTYTTTATTTTTTVWTGSCAVTFELDHRIVGSAGRSANLLVTAQCPRGVYSYQMVIDLAPGHLGAISPSGTETATGFMTGGTRLVSGTEYRWFNLNANGQSSGTLTVPVTISSGLPSGGGYQVTLNQNTAFKDTGGNSMGINPPLPLSVTVNVLYPVTVQMTFQALDAYFAGTVWTPIGRVPTVGEIFDLLDIYFGG